jgi:V/A-type H+/Na+-transporting ATPase subunit I
MILADAGYAALIGLLTLALWKRMDASAAGRRMRVLLVALAGVSFAYGVAAGSYFGFPPPEGGLLARLAVIDVTDFEAMMRVSVLIGALHIAIGLGTVAWLNRGTGRAIASLGWIGVIAGGLLFWLGESTAAGTAATALMVAGLSAVFWGNGSTRPVEKPVDWLWRIADGLLGLTSATKLFGDLLSYLRLFALGLASASLAATFNTLAMDLAASKPGVGVLLAILVLIFGHSINILIGIMSGVVHGLRLNYVEFFGWGLTEEGYPFRAFAKRELPA